MQPLQRIEFIDQQIHLLLATPPAPELQPGGRQRMHAALAEYWSSPDPQGRSRQLRLSDLRRALMHAELDLRLADRTLPPPTEQLLRTCLDLPLAWQRRHQPRDRRPYVYRAVLQRNRPNQRIPIPGLFLIQAGGEEGQALDPAHATTPALLCGMAQGIEAYNSLAELHVELCERLDDPIQGEALLSLLTGSERREQARQADRLRYEWFADDPIEAQIESLVEAQRQRLNAVWASAAPDRDALLRALQVTEQAGSRALLETRYGLLVEQNLPEWMRNASLQAQAHLVQTMQRLVAAGNRVAAPGIPTLHQFRQRHSLQEWTRQRLEERLRHDLGLVCAAADILVNVVHTRQVGPHLHPFQPSSYVTWHGFSQVGGQLIETVKETYPLDVLAQHNLAWFDYDYWLTARVTQRHGKPLPSQLSPNYVKNLVRQLNVGGTYSEFLKTQLLETPIGAWRLNAHALVNRARMAAEAAKARHAGHLANSPDGRAHRWIQQVLDHAHNALRPPIDGQRIMVRQFTLQGHTVQNVLMIDSDAPGERAFVLYTPDAPDRRVWRSLANGRELLRLLRSKPALREYVAARVPQLAHDLVFEWLQKGRLGPHLRTPPIDDDLFYACYQAEVRAMLAAVDASSRTTDEANVEQAIAIGWRLLDLICIVLPAKVLVPLSLGRMAMEVWDAVEAYRESDLDGVLQHIYNVLSFANETSTSLGGTGLMRRILRGMPVQPPLPLPLRYSLVPELHRLRFHIDPANTEGVYEKPSEFEGLSQYFIKDAQDRHYKVTFDGQRWRVLDPVQPDRYLNQPVKRLANGDWVIDSPLLWYDGLPDLQQLLDDCRSSSPLAGTPSDEAPGLHEADGQLYLQTERSQLPLRRHLLPGRYHLPIPGAASAGVRPWAVMRWNQRQWRIQVRQAGRSSDWLALPQAYSVSRGSSRSRR